ncbi:MAG: alpha/beta hydrolase [Hyphomicrobiales bacterium]|nr:alpha/beta hydrolase [Alphaproteobacteria bacterium]
MPFAQVRGIKINYQVIGDRGPWAALITGGRRGHDEFVPLAQMLANGGYRVVLHDRRNTGASDVLIEGDVAEEILWLDDLHELLKQLGAVPTIIGGSSAGARTAMRYYNRFPSETRALLLMRVTGGAFAANRLPEMYYGAFIKAAQDGGMAGVCATEQYQERIAANPQTKDRLMAMDPKKYIAVMSNWRDQFIESTKTEVFGMTNADLAAIKVPTVVIPGNDQTHASANGRLAASKIPGAVLHQLPIVDQEVPLINYAEWAPYEQEIAQAFLDLMRKADAQRPRSGQAAAS